MKRFSTFFLLIITLIFMSGCVSEPPKCPLEGEWVFVPEFSDEFNSKNLDTLKWFDHNPGWLGRQPSYFSRNNVRIEDKMLVLESKRENLDSLPEGYHTFTSAAVQSRERILYGYFEILTKPMDSQISSAFWFYAIDSTVWTEIDVFEISGKHTDKEWEHKFWATTHVMKYPDTLGYRSDHVLWNSPHRLADKFITVGLDWNETEIVWYVDGKEIRRRENTYWHQPLTINFDSETMPEWWGLPADDDNGGKFLIDYIRVWKRK